MTFKQLDEYPMIGKDETSPAFWHPVDNLVRARSGFELVRIIDKMRIPNFTAKYRVYPHKSAPHFRDPKIIEVARNHDLYPGAQGGIYISPHLLQDLITDYIPKPLLDYWKQNMGENPKWFDGEVMFSDDDGNIFEYWQNVDDRASRLSKFRDSLIKRISSVDKIAILLGEDERSVKWRKDGRAYCLTLLEFIRDVGIPNDIELEGEKREFLEKAKELAEFYAQRMRVE